ncbi:hypothetical protein PVAP13_1NG348219 [Panicum virgatum]|uniref:Uncharacterized protein n=1 Tax=Panicum virgatum TaxID=38727 RepID=A0A8T0X4U3_PANVG|nr:hypothetical protein PVAP13_1NG348219 [Panicum virgatum]
MSECTCSSTTVQNSVRFGFPLLFRGNLLRCALDQIRPAPPRPSSSPPVTGPGRARTAALGRTRPRRERKKRSQPNGSLPEDSLVATYLWPSAPPLSHSATPPVPPTDPSQARTRRRRVSRPAAPSPGRRRSRPSLARVLGALIA